MNVARLSLVGARRLPQVACAKAAGVGFALLLTLVVNGLGMWLLLKLNARNVAAPAASSRAVVDVDFTTSPPPRKRKERPQPKRHRQRAPSRPAVQPLPSAPSTIAADRLEMPSLDAAGLIDGAAVEEDLGRSARLVFQEDEVDQRPRLVRRVPPRYPARAADRGVEGEVGFRVLIGRDGRVQRVEIERARPPGVFEHAVREAVRSWRFEPASYQGQNVAVWARSRLVFQLEGGR